MKILYRDLKQNIIKVVVENLDDLWYLSHIITPGDVVSARTERRIKAKDDITHAGGSERVSIFVGLKVVKADFSLEGGVYRITGIVESGPEDVISLGSYHTLNIEEGSVLSIKKERWSSLDLQRLYEAEKSTLRPKILVAVVDEGEAFLGLVRESKVEEYEISRNIGGKYDTRGRQERKNEFYSQLASSIKKVLEKENISAVILAGAGFEKENFFKYLSQHHPQVAEKSVIENIGSHGRAGLYEVMKRSEFKTIQEEANTARDMKLISRLLEELGRDSGLAVYGLSDVEAAAEAGAVDFLLICDDFYMKNRSQIESLVEKVKNSRGLFHIVNRSGDAGKQLNSLGGVAAVLRFKIR